ncbi:MAG: rod shape-determining protein MreC [Clostridia bacterium]|nr:rod shape-determining protein MreC [Clostridia bacterium]
MRDLFKNKFFITLIIVTVLFLVLAFVYNSDSVKAPFLKSVIGTVVKPVQSAFTYTTSGIKNFFGNFESIDKLQKENSELKDTINKLNDRLRKIEGMEAENQRLQSLLELKQSNGQFKYVAANIIYKDYGGWYESFTINKGADDGIKKNDAVVTSDGLVGCVTEVYNDRATVLSIIDSSSSVGATISRTKDNAIVDGDMNLKDKNQCKLSFSSKKSGIIVGDLVETSGLGDVYPKGILIGKVSEINDDGKEIVISASVDFEKIFEVLVIVGE